MPQSLAMIIQILLYCNYLYHYCLTAFEVYSYIYILTYSAIHGYIIYNIKGVGMKNKRSWV